MIILRIDEKQSPAFIPTRLLSCSDAPHLSAATESDVESFLSPSGSVAARARNAHNEMLQWNRRPWWKRLGDIANAGETSLTHPQEAELELGQKEATETE